MLLKREQKVYALEKDCFGTYFFLLKENCLSENIAMDAILNGYLLFTEEIGQTLS